MVDDDKEERSVLKFKVPIHMDCYGLSSFVSVVELILLIGKFRFIVLQKGRKV